MTLRTHWGWLSVPLFVAACGIDHEVLSRSAAGGAAGNENSAGASGSGAGGGAGTTQTTGFAARALDTSDYGTCAIVGGNVWCWGGQGDEPNPGVFKTSPAQVILSEAVTSLAAGATHFCALTQTGSVYCWGSNSAFQLGSGDTSAAGPVRVPLLGAASSGRRRTQLRHHRRRHALVLGRQRREPTRASRSKHCAPCRSGPSRHR
jgi:hypothetical protein